MSRSKTRTCGGKVRYRDHDQAIRAIHRLQSRSSREKQVKRAYWCDGCNGWHLTSRAQWREAT